ncbi:hypothetical protein EDD15DRAFT_681210 [Pisolithus albus]|nr:hypothetical protein EDD15DRAFT_681210 [Pisolithus albus]
MGEPFALASPLVVPGCPSAVHNAAAAARGLTRAGQSDPFAKFIPHVLSPCHSRLCSQWGTKYRAAYWLTLPKVASPIRVNFLSLVVGDHYFRSLLVSASPTEDLLALRDAITETLSHLSPRPAPMFPHLSLAYIADEDAEAGERERAAAVTARKRRCR